MDNKTEFIVFGAPDIRNEEIQEVVDTLKSGWIGTGPKVKKFEQDFAQYKNIQSRLSPYRFGERNELVRQTINECICTFI